MRDVAKDRKAIGSCCERDHRVPRLSWSSTAANGTDYSSSAVAVITGETEADAQDLVKVSHTSGRPETTCGPVSFL